MKQRDKPRKASHCVWVCRVCSNSKAMFAAQPETRFHLLDQGFTVWRAMLKPERAEAQLRRLARPGEVEQRLGGYVCQPSRRQISGSNSVVCRVYLTASPAMADPSTMRASGEHRANIGF